VSDCLPRTSTRQLLVLASPLPPGLRQEGCHRAASLRRQAVNLSSFAELCSLQSMATHGTHKAAGSTITDAPPPLPAVWRRPPGGAAWLGHRPTTNLLDQAIVAGARQPVPSIGASTPLNRANAVGSLTAPVGQSYIRPRSPGVGAQVRPLAGQAALRRSSQPTSQNSCAPMSISACCAAHHNAADIARDGRSPYSAAAAAAVSGGCARCSRQVQAPSCLPPPRSRSSLGSHGGRGGDP